VKQLIHILRFDSVIYLSDIVNMSPRHLIEGAKRERWLAAERRAKAVEVQMLLSKQIQAQEQY